MIFYLPELRYGDAGPNSPRCHLSQHSAGKGEP